MLCIEPVTVANPMLPVPCTVHSVTQELAGTFTLVLHSADGRALPRFKPGQFSMLWSFGVGEAPVSISGDAADTTRLVYTIRSVGKTSEALVAVSPGTPIGVRGPFGSSWPVETARGRDVVIVAGGIGLAPLRPAIYSVFRNRSNFGKLTILYGTRRPEDMLFSAELAEWARQPDTEVLTTVDAGGLDWTGNVGVVTTLFRYTRLRPAACVAMVCGPEIMMRFAARELQTQGLNPADIYLSMERNMKCAIGFCGHCQWGPYFICKDGPVFDYGRIGSLLGRHEL